MVDSAALLAQDEISPTSVTSAASSTTRPACRRPASAGRDRHGLLHRGRAYVPAMSDQSIIVRHQGTIFLGGPRW